jgi:thioredoxin-like negative regulator of GroEL
MGLLEKLFGGGKVTPDHVATLEDFRRVVVESTLPVIVDVWSPTCAPCKKLESVLINVATRYKDRVRVAEISTAAEPALLLSLDVRSTPTLLVFKSGKELGRMAGYRPEAWFDDMIKAEFPGAGA